MSTRRSRVENVRKLQTIWFDGQVFDLKLHSALDSIGFTEAYVNARIAQRDARPRSPKAIKDAVWGMMEFDGAAMRLIDSPILQRLRRIHQLGFSALTYPSAEHSRFPHSIGMAHVVGRFVEAIDRKRSPDAEMQKGVLGYKGMADLKPLTGDDLVHAALLHDTGHLPFSHAAESAIEASRKRFTFGGLSYNDFQVRAEHQLAKISLSEALSLAIVLSTRFGKFYSNYVLDTPDDDAVLRIACLIAGQRVIDECANIQDIISSSSVDADKVDYVNRDAEACGIPIGVDVSRVFLGSGVLALEAQKAADLGYHRDDRYIFALNASGWDTFDEIIRARSTLYQRVYLHAVTRTAESVFARALKLNAEDPNASAGGVALKDAISLWASSDVAVIDELSRSADPAVSRLGRAIRDRILPKKACALGQNVLQLQAPLDSLLPKIFDGGEHVGAKVAVAKMLGGQFTRRYTRQSQEAVDTVEFEDAVRDEAIKIAAALRALGGAAAKRVPAGTIEDVVFIAISTLDQRKSDAPVFQHGELLSADTFTNVRGVTDATDHFRQVGYVMAAPEWREIVLLATRTVLYQRSMAYPIRLYGPEGRDEQTQAALSDTLTVRLRPLTLIDPNAVLRRVGVSRQGFERTFQALEDTGYFDDFPLLAARELSSNHVDIARRVNAFSGEAGWSVTAESCAAFTDQFPPRLRDDVRGLLSKIVLLTRDDLHDRLQRAIRTLQPKYPDGLIVVPLSSSSGGAAVASLKHLPAGVSIAQSLAQAVARRKGECIVLVDDNASSGVQASAQLYAFMGVPAGERPEDLAKENDLFESALEGEDLKAFRAGPLAVCVALGRQEAADRLARAAEALGLTGFGGLTYDGKIGANDAISEPLGAYLAQVGRDLVAQDRYETAYAALTDKAQRAVCETHALGYGGAGGLTFFPSTAPTSAVTALWMPGEVASRPWIPLFLRWGRLAKVVLA